MLDSGHLQEACNASARAAHALFLSGDLAGAVSLLRQVQGLSCVGASRAVVLHELSAMLLQTGDADAAVSVLQEAEREHSTEEGRQRLAGAHIAAAARADPSLDFTTEYHPMVLVFSRRYCCLSYCCVLSKGVLCVIMLFPAIKLFTRNLVSGAGGAHASLSRSVRFGQPSARPRGKHRCFPREDSIACPPGAQLVCGAHSVRGRIQYRILQHRVVCLYQCLSLLRSLHIDRVASFH